MLRVRADQVNFVAASNGAANERPANRNSQLAGANESKEPKVEGERTLPGGGNLNIGVDEKRNNKGDYLNVWHQEIKQKEENKKREREEKIRREREELQAAMNYNPFGKKDGGPGAGRVRQSPAIN